MSYRQYIMNSSSKLIDFKEECSYRRRLVEFLMILHGHGLVVIKIIWIILSKYTTDQ